MYKAHTYLSLPLATGEIQILRDMVFSENLKLGFCLGELLGLMREKIMLKKTICRIGSSPLTGPHCHHYCPRGGTSRRLLPCVSLLYIWTAKGGCGLNWCRWI